MLKCWNKSSSRSTKAGGQKGEMAGYRFDCDVSSNCVGDTTSNTHLNRNQSVCEGVSGVHLWLLLISEGMMQKVIAGRFGSIS